MKKLFAIIFLLACVHLAFANKTANFQFSIDSLSISQIETENDTLTQIRMGSMTNDTRIDYYSLPVKYVLFSVPNNAENFTISTQGSITKKLNVSYPIASNIGQTLGKINGDLLPTLPISECVNARICHIGMFNGQFKVVEVALYPIVTELRNNDVLDFYSDITLNLEYTLNTNSSLSIATPFKPYDKKQLDILKKTAINGYEINECELFSPLSIDMEEYEYIIITPKRFAPALERLAAIRRTKGKSAKVFTLEEILSSTMFENGDITSGINDDSGKIREFLKYANFHFGTRHVLFAGRYPEMPIRYAYSQSLHKYFTNRDGTEDNPYDKFIPSDFYFSELNNIWKESQEFPGKFIPQTTCFDKWDEISIGRININSLSEANIYIDKLIENEFHLKDVDLKYLSNAMQTYQTYGNGMGIFKQNLKNDIEKLYIDDQISYLNEHEFPKNGLTGKLAIKHWNSLPCGHICFIGHGNYGGIGLNSDNNGIVGFDEYECWHQSEQGNGLDCLKLQSYPSWAFSIACGVMPYDYMIAENGLNVPSPYTFADAYTLLRDTGGVLFFGNTRASFNTDGKLFKNQFYSNIEQSMSSPDPTYIESGYIQNTTLSSQGFGDPELFIRGITGDPCCTLWTDIPQKFKPIFLETDSTEVRNFRIAKNVDSLNIFEVSLIDKSFSRSTTLNKSEFDNISLQPNYLYTLGHKDYLPEILPLNIRNFTFWLYSSNYIFAKDVNIGVEDSSTTEKVLIAPTHSLTIEAKGNVYVNYGLDIQDNATLTIKCDGDVYVSTFYIGNHATFNIEAENVYYDKGDFYCGTDYTINFVSRNQNHQNAKKLSIEAEYNPMVVEGRTWWYDADEWSSNMEYGVRIGSKVEIDSVEWHKVYVCLHHKTITGPTYIDSSHPWLERDENTGLMGLIREKDGKVYFSCGRIKATPAVDKQSLYGMLDYSIIFDGWDFDVLLYDFSTEDNYVMGAADNVDLDLAATRIGMQLISRDVIDNCGHRYNTSLFNVKPANPRYVDFYSGNVTIVEGIGLIGELNTDSYFDSRCLFYAPFPRATSNPPGPPTLHYVTDADNNIIYMHAGGDKLWEKFAEYNGVEDINVDSADLSGAEYYNLQGQRITAPVKGNIYIRTLKNGRTEKVRF